MQFYTYLYEDVNGIPIYVGKGQDKCAYRHKTKRTRLGNVIRKRNKDGIILVPTITYHHDEVTAFAMEKFWIAVYGREDLSTGTLFNLTDGGEGTSGIKRKPFSLEHRQKISKVQIGRVSPNKGKPMTDEQKKKISESNKSRTAWNSGSQISEEQKTKISESKKGKPWTEARRLAQQNRTKENQ